MFKKILIQISLIILVILIVFFFFTKYLKKESLELESGINNINESEKNSIQELSYESTDAEGRKYLITALNGALDQENNNTISMNKVAAKIILTDGNIINIISDKAKYNNVTLNTDFEKNVKMSFLDHKINCDIIKITFTSDILEAYNNLTYQNLDLIMSADKIEINLKTKNSKIFNFDQKNVNIRKINGSN